jgi:carbonic anhydrase
MPKQPDFDADSWSYSGTTGPEHWHEIAPICAQGKRQSPIDLEDIVRADIEPIRFDYEASAKAIVNNGRALQVHFSPGNTLAADGGHFTLDHLHFHVPAEHEIGGKTFALEAHFVNRDERGNIVVIALLYKLGPADVALAKILPRLPAETNARNALDESLNAAAFLPESLDYYFYQGSLTTPPCSEGVDWFVLQTQLTASREQAQALMRAIGGANNRPLQARNGREVLVPRRS